MVVRLGINGLGRIGESVVRAFIEHRMEGVEVAAVNARRSDDDLVHSLKYDSIMGRLNKDISVKGDILTIDGHKIKRFQTGNPEEIDWSSADVDVVLECTGVFKSHADASRHLGGSVKKVLISAPSSDADAMVVYGVNNEILKGDEKVISVGSCTTNCLAPVAKVLNDKIGIKSGFMTTIHSYTNDQRVLDGTHKDRRRSRAAALSMIPTTTGAARALGKVIPQLQGKIDGTSIRVPTPNVSLVDLVFTAERDTNLEEINKLIKEASTSYMQGVLAYCDEELVSIDFEGNPHSSVFDATQTYQVEGGVFRVASWYDNEWGFSCRMLDVAKLVG